MKKKKRQIAGNNSTTDTYYEDQSRKAIQTAVKEAEGKPPGDIRFLIRRSYPFGPLRKGRPYKIWNRLVLRKESELGLEPRHHKLKIYEK